jgi:hypothetical protein
MVMAVWMMRQQVTTRRALGGKRGHCSVGAVHGGESDDPILALALAILVDDLGLVLADQDVIQRKPQRRIELVPGDDVKGDAGPHLDQRAVDGDEFDFVVVTG